jgi:hypothetical protein
MHKSRMSLTKWFLAMYLFVSSRQRISGWDFARQVGLSYAAAWLWLHKLRSALGRRTAELRQGAVEVDETYEVGFRRGSGGGRPSVSDKSSLIVGAVEVPARRKGFGRLRLASLASATAEDLGAFVEDNVAAGATLLTDGFASYRTAAIASRYRHVRRSVWKSGRHGRRPQCAPTAERRQVGEVLDGRVGDRGLRGRARMARECVSVGHRDRRFVLALGIGGLTGVRRGRGSGRTRRRRRRRRRAARGDPGRGRDRHEQSAESETPHRFAPTPSAARVTLVVARDEIMLRPATPSAARRRRTRPRRHGWLRRWQRSAS